LSIMGEVFGEDVDEDGVKQEVELTLGVIEMKRPGGEEIVEYQKKVIENFSDDAQMYEISARILKDWSLVEQFRQAKEDELVEEVHKKLTPGDWMAVWLWYAKLLGSSREDMRKASQDPDFHRKRRTNKR